MSQKFDIIILGTGNAGFRVSQIAQAAGKSIAFVESGDFGGTCPNRGCTPKKVLVAAAETAGLEFDAITSDMSGWFSSRFYAETVAWAKVLVEKGSRRIVGAHLVGHHGEELIHLFALAMRHAISADQLADEMYAFPTFAADIKSML